MVLGQEKAKTSDGALGCTFQYDKYIFKNYSFYDTVGISEGSKGTVKKEEAIKNLLELIIELKKSSGIHLLIFVMKLGRISGSLQTNYEMFVTIMTEAKVPVALVITHAESEPSKNAWFLKNRDHFKRYEMNFANVTSVCASKGAKFHENLKCFYEERYLESRFDVLQIIDEVSLDEPWLIKEMTAGLKVKSMMNGFFNLFNWPFPLWADLSEFLERNGFERLESIKLANKVME